MQEIVDYLISQIKQQHDWRLEEEGCGGDEIMESWDINEERILTDIQNIKSHNSEYVTVRKSCQNCYCQDRCFHKTCEPPQYKNWTPKEACLHIFAERHVK